MPQVYLYPSVTGAQSGLAFDTDEYRWLTKRPQGYWSCRGSVSTNETADSLDELAALESFQLVTRPPQEWVSSLQSLCGDTHPQWSLAMPRKAYLSYLNQATESCSRLLSSVDLSYYAQVWLPSRSLFQSIARMAAPDPQIFLELNEHEAAAFKARGGLCDRVEYDRFGTRTGRLTVSSGPPILTLRKDLRKFLRSRRGELGTLLQIDFSALEVRLLISDPDKKVATGDPYQSLADVLGILRKDAKLALISTTYGASDWGLASSLSVSIEEARRCAEVIRHNYRVESQVSRLRAEHSSTGFIRNRYGRRVDVPDPSDGSLLNSYLQSTGVDVSLLGFKSVIDKLPEEHCTPVALIHDAMLLDVSRELAQKMLSRGHINVAVQGYEGKFPLKVEDVS